MFRAMKEGNSIMDRWKWTSEESEESGKATRLLLQEWGSNKKGIFKMKKRWQV